MKKNLFLVAAVLTAGMSFQAMAEANNEKPEEKSVKQEDSAGKPQLIISGEAQVHPNFGKPHNTYYGKAVTKDKAEPEKIDYSKSDKDSTMTRIVAGEADIDFKAVGKLDNGVKYMAEIDLDAMKDDTGVDKMYISFSRDNLGTLHIGNVKGPDAKCIYSGQQLLGGTTGMDGTIPHSFDYATGVIAPVYMIGYSSKATKISYYSPRFYGFQLSASVTPDTKHHGHTDKNWHAGSASNGNDNGMFLTKDRGDEKPSGRNNIAFALTHVYEFQNGVRTKLSGIYVFEDTKNVDVTSYERTEANHDGDKIEAKAKLRNVSSYQLSATVGYKKWDFGIGFIDNGRSRTLRSLKSMTTGKTDEQAMANIGNFLGSTKANAGKAWNIGARYQVNDQLTLSGVFHHTKRKVDTNAYTRGNMLTLAADYKIVDGLVLFAEIDYIKTKSCEEACKRYNMIFNSDKKRNAIMKQHGELFVIGAKVCF